MHRGCFAQFASLRYPACATPFADPLGYAAAVAVCEHAGRESADAAIAISLLKPGGPSLIDALDLVCDFHLEPCGPPPEKEDD